mmetsp:Transcript_4439/g.13765  ORF Transcript_4439/g.13765 Transcript_4439/m.13765 type:complete len:243 (+) Transcript_4439:799-1527(+)
MTWRMPLVCGTHWMRPQSSVSGSTAKVVSCRPRRRLASSRCSSTLSRPANSIMRKSLRRSSLGLARKGQSRPSVPLSVTFLGACRLDMTSTRSSMPWMRGESSRKGECRAAAASLPRDLPFVGLAASSGGVVPARSTGIVGRSASCSGTMTLTGSSRGRPGTWSRTEKWGTLRLARVGCGGGLWLHKRISWSTSWPKLLKSALMSSASKLRLASVMAFEAASLRAGTSLLSRCAIDHSAWCG